MEQSLRIPCLVLAFSVAVSTLFVWRLVSLSRRAVARFSERASPEFSAAAITELRNVLARIDFAKAHVYPVGSDEVLVQEAWLVGDALIEVSKSLSRGDLQIERFCGYMLRRIGLRFRRLASWAGHPLLSSEAADDLSRHLNALLSGIQAKDVRALYVALVNLLFVAAGGKDTGVTYLRAQAPLHRKFVFSAREYVTQVFDQNNHKQLVEFPEEWAEWALRVRDARIYLFMDVLSDLKDRVFEVKPDWLFSAEVLLTNDLRRHVLDFLRAYSRSDLLGQYRSIAAIITHIQTAITGTHPERYVVRLEWPREVELRGAPGFEESSERSEVPV